MCCKFLNIRKHKKVKSKDFSLVFKGTTIQQFS